MQHLETLPEQMAVPPMELENCRKLDFDSVELEQIEKGYWIVKVRGSKPHAHMKVELVPSSHLRQPDYWRIDVRGCVCEAIKHPRPTPFEVTLPLAACRGVKGIEIFGGSGSRRYDIPK